MRTHAPIEGSTDWNQRLINVRETNLKGVLMLGSQFTLSWKQKVFASGCLLLLAPLAASAQIEITLKNAFIERYKNRATIDATFTVDKAHARPNPPSKDGDLHIAGRAPEVGLATVAEIVNAKGQPDAVGQIHDVEGTGTPIHVSGAWRIWCEHGGSSEQKQGATLEPFNTTNPDHVFEIHPLTQIGSKSIVNSFTFIEGYEAKDAEEAFTNYENKQSKMTYSSSHKTTTITTSMGGYNYVEFKMVLNELPRKVVDGYLVLAGVHTLDGNLLVRNRRMVFVDGTPPAVAVQSASKGDTLVVLGIPRISLALVSYRTGVRNTRPAALTWNLPYEIIIVGVKERLPADQ
jgi:hypothetical protein